MPPPNTCRAKTLLIGVDLIRASVALALPFIDAIWQVYVLIFVLQAASATFTPEVCWHGPCSFWSGWRAALHR